ncbi:MAG: serine hydrolase, partial [Myxococcales bacterium]|nr:serine hydrolase [Myxococcales bacterium]
MRPTPTLALLLAACASRPVPVPESTPTPVAVPAPESATGSEPEAVTEAVTAEPARVSIPAIDAVVSSAIAESKLPGAVVTVGRSNGILFQRAYGHRSLVPERTPMTEDVIFDLASLTKPLVTAALVHKLAEERKLGLGDPIARHLPELDGKRTGEITILQLLLHSSGLPRVTRLRDYELPREQALANLLATRTEHRPGARYLYGDVAYLWLGVLIERVAGVPLDRLAREHLFQPLGLTHTRFRPPADWLPRIAPTERTDKRPSPLIHGVVHDPRAYRLGGVAGNAGLFSTADDLARLARTLLQRGSLDGQRVLSAHSVDTMTRPHPVGTRTVRTPGWDVRSDYDTHRGTRLSPAAYGHGGYTGVSLWIDPQLDLFVLFLSNRVHPDGDGNVLQLAGDVADAAVAAIAPSA